MHNVQKALENIRQNEREWKVRPILSFAQFLEAVREHPERIFRNVYQAYADMFRTYVKEIEEGDGDDPETINYLNYDSSQLFVANSDRPFFADRLLINRLVSHVESLSVGAQQNRIYVFEGPHGSGKSTFLTNLLRKFEEYSATEEGIRYETVWRLRREQIASGLHSFTDLKEQLVRHLIDESRMEVGAERAEDVQGDHGSIAGHLLSYRTDAEGSYFEVVCPSHDNPLLHVPKSTRRRFFDDLLGNDAFKWKLSTEKQYDWVFRDTPCTICMSIYQALMNTFNDPQKVLEMVYARPYIVNRRIGQGISVYNPGDRPRQNSVLRNDAVQQGLDLLFGDSSPVNYIYSSYAKTNDGIYGLMDIKSHNIDRLMELHNIISDGVHRVEDTEEYVTSLLLATMNPEDKKKIDDLQAFSDRIQYINIPYILDLKTEVEIYRNTFGTHIDESFLPRVLHNFARVIIATRLNVKSDAMLNWIGNPKKYDLYCDQNLQLLKMEIYTGFIPKWLSEDDFKGLTAKKRQQIIAESERDGWQGLSGRDSLEFFNEFYSYYASEDKLIDMSMLVQFFKKFCKRDKSFLPLGFLDSLLKMYNYAVLQEVKEALYYYNETQIAKEIQNYIFAVNFEPGSSVLSSFTQEKIEVNDEFFDRIEAKLFVAKQDAPGFRRDVQKEYTTQTLPQEILRDGLSLVHTGLFKHLHEKYVHHLKEKVLEPFMRNENFRMAVKEYGEDSFRTYDKKIRYDVTYMITNLQRKYHYSQRGAKEICMYVIDNNLAEKFVEVPDAGPVEMDEM